MYIHNVSYLMYYICKFFSIGILFYYYNRYTYTFYKVKKYYCIHDLAIIVNIYYKINYNVI